MDVLRAINGRRAVREYSAEPVPDMLIRQLIAAAVQAPSAANEQPWCFTVVRDKALLARMSRDIKGHMSGTSAVGLVSRFFEGHLSDPAFDVFYAAPALLVISTVTDTPWAVEDCSLAAENLMLTAHSIGLGTCWVGVAQAWLRTPAGKESLSLPLTHVPVAPIVVGHPKSAPTLVSRGEPNITWIGS